MENVIAAAQAIYTDEQRMLLENFRKMAEAEFAPLAEKYEDLGHPPDADTLKSLFAKVEEFGLISGLIPEEDGGAGIDRMTYGILYEELARIWADLAIAVLIQSHAVFAVNLLGDAAQKETYLKPLLRSQTPGFLQPRTPGLPRLAYQKQQRPSSRSVAAGLRGVDLFALG